MIPTGSHNMNPNASEVMQPSLTWRLDLDQGRIFHKVDGLDAIKQAVFKSLQTDRFHHLIYSADYGHELYSVIGKDAAYAASEIKRCIREALLQDDRINEITNLELITMGDQATVRFQVVSVLGSYQEEVTVDV